ncbi:hypothetical protein BBJ28_00006657 [Nothophytophthora sp. Chile5]|nr:hypothetical protein BBJ28_00006657 [Nothophytophthora sp. Chile5]
MRQMSGAKTLLVLGLLSVVRVQSVPWWGDVGAAHGARATPLTLAELAGAPKDWGIESNIAKGFPSGLRQLSPTNPAFDSDKSELQPRLSKVPPSAVLDENHDGNTTPMEWEDYVQNVLKVALSIIDQGRDPVAQAFLRGAAFFHYNTLGVCIHQQLLKSPNMDFTTASSDIQANCYVKYRLSLFGAPPPFEQIAGREEAIPSSEIETWFDTQLAIAREDAAKRHEVQFSDAAEAVVEMLVSCVYVELKSWVNDFLRFRIGGYPIELPSSRLTGVWMTIAAPSNSSQTLDAPALPSPSTFASDYPLTPRSRIVPPSPTIDEDGNGHIIPSEWIAYVGKLYNIAEKMVAASPDPIAREFLDKIIQFHYANLEQCIRLKFEQATDKSFAVVSADVESHCYVKFRYSLFAGPPPFELIAHFEPTITAREMEVWFRWHLTVARTDLTEHRVFNLSQENEVYLETLVACMHEELDTWV